MKEIKESLQAAVKRAFGEVQTEVPIVLTRPEAQFGDYASNVALQLGKKLAQNPRQVAEKIISELPKSSIITKAEVAGPGFINLTLTDQALWHQANQTPRKSLQNKVVVAEYSDPNPFKVLHAGHLYTSLVGDAIAKLLESAGADVKRVNFGGDVGLHVGKAMWAILEELGGEKPNKLESIVKVERLDWISNCYVKGNEAYENDERAKQEIIEINKKVYQLHKNGDRESPFAQVYWTCRQWSYDGFEKLYQDLGMKPFDKYYPESITTPTGLKTIQQGLAKGVFVKSDGAVVFKGEAEGLHTRVFLNSEGLPTYETKDLGLAQQKWDDYQFDASVMITGNDIVEYMKVVLAALKNFHLEIAERTKHLTHGMVKLAGGVKMSSRKGNILRASDILQSATKAIKEMDQEPKNETVLAAVKYAFLKNRIGGDVIYDPKESVALEGNSGPYLQYAHARACSILKKAGAKPSVGGKLEADERSLVRKISEHSEVVERATNELMPHHICNYLYELSQVFNRFYENNRVIGDAREAERVGLVELYKNTLKNGLELLGISAPDRM